jgi:hypothetical protein
MGYGRTADVYFIEAMKYFNHYDKPVVDMDNNVITHWSDVQAAVANCIAGMEIYRVDMTIIQLRRFIAMKHRYHRMDLIAGYNTVKFFEGYLTGDTDGIALAASMQGTTREKIANLMQTSDSTVKRLMEVGKHKFEKLGLIEEGYVSFKQVLDEIKAERLAEASDARKALQQVQSIQPRLPEPPSQLGESYYEQPDVEEEGNKMPSLPETFYEPAQEDENSDSDSGGDGQPYYELDESDDRNETEEPIKPLFDDFNCIFSSGGLGQVEITVSNNVPTVVINGKELKNMSYEVLVDEQETNNTVHSFVLSQPGKNALCFQLTIENFSKAA